MRIPSRAPETQDAREDIAEPSPLAPRTYSIKEVAALLGISKNSAYAAVRDGSLPSIAIGGRRLIPRAQFDRMLEGER